MKFYYFSTHLLIDVRNNINWSWVIDYPNFIFSYAPKNLTAVVVSVTVYVTYPETSIFERHTATQRFIFQLISFPIVAFYLREGVQFRGWCYIFWRAGQNFRKINIINEEKKTDNRVNI